VFLTNYSTFLSKGKDRRKYRSNFTNPYFSLNRKLTLTAGRKSYVVFILPGMIEEQWRSQPENLVMLSKYFRVHKP
jgi:hypothetical protein